jgi:hypothetical protein
MNKINIIIPLPYDELDDLVLTSAMIEAIAIDDFKKYHDILGAYTFDDTLAEVSEFVKLVSIINRLENVLMPKLKMVIVTEIRNLIKEGYSIYDIGNYYGNTKITLEYNGSL